MLDLSHSYHDSLRNKITSFPRRTREQKMEFALNMVGEACNIFTNTSNCAYENCGHDTLLAQGFIAVISGEKNTMSDKHECSPSNCNSRQECEGYTLAKDLLEYKSK